MADSWYIDKDNIISDIRNNYELLLDTISEHKGLTTKFINLYRDLPKKFDDLEHANNYLNLINKRYEHYNIESYRNTEHLYNIKTTINELFDNYENHQEVDEPLNTVTVYNNETESYCEYRGCCEMCLSGDLSKEQNYNYCKNKCIRCKEFRDQFLKKEKKEAREFFMQYIPKTKIKPNQPIELLVPVNINTISFTDNIVNNTIINNQVNNFIQVNLDSTIQDTNIKSIESDVFVLTDDHIEEKYVFTKDRFFNITIQAQSNNEEAINNLKYIFINLICGAVGKKLFPSENSYSTAVTYIVKSALYTITNPGLPILSGIIRYEHIVNKTFISVKKLENLNTTNKKTPTIIKASQIKLWQDKKHHHSKEHIDFIINNITKTNYYGSDIKDFYKL